MTPEELGRWVRSLADKNNAFADLGANMARRGINGVLVKSESNQLLSKFSHFVLKM